MVFIRRVRTGSGATAVQAAEYSRGKQKIVKHFGSARSVAELGILEARAREWIDDGQQVLDLGISAGAEQVPARGLVGNRDEQPALFGQPGTEAERVPSGTVSGTSAGVLRDVLAGAYRCLGLNAVGDEVFASLVIARIVEPTSKLDAPRVMRELGMPAPSYSTLKRTLGRVTAKGYRNMIARACFAHSVATTGISLLLYDVSTLYFEAEYEDDYRKVGYSKERRVDPQILIGILVDRTGFPLEVHSYEGNKAETATIIPVIKAFTERNQVADMVVVADTGMLSAANLKALDEAGLRFIVGSRQTKAPHDLATYFHWNGTYHQDGATVDTLTPRGKKRLDPARVKRRAEPVWDVEQHPEAWRAVWQYRRKRALRDEQTLNHQRNRAIAIIDGSREPKKARFVKDTKAGDKTFDETAYQRASDLAGWKGYVCNIPADLMPAAEVVASYHELWHVEQSFRMSKHDLRARPIHAYLRDSIEAHLTVVFAALAVSRYIQQQSGLAIGNVVKRLRPLRSATIHVAGVEQEFPPQIPDDEQAIIDSITGTNITH